MHDTYHRRNRFIKKFLIKVITEKNLSSLETGMTFFLHILIVCEIKFAILILFTFEVLGSEILLDFWCAEILSK